MGRRRQPDDLALTWRALANPLRREILDLLRDGPQTTGWLALRFPGHSRFAGESDCNESISDAKHRRYPR